MAAIYATPPPDLNSEDAAALSDVSNSPSSMNTPNNKQMNNNKNIDNNSTSNNSNASDEALTTPNTKITAKTDPTTTTKSRKRSITDPTLQQQHKKRQSSSPLAVVDVRSNPSASDMDTSDEAANLAVADTTTVKQTQSTSVAIVSVAAAANAAMQLQLLEAINDAAKKRRKQNNPSRLGVLNLNDVSFEACDESSERIAVDTLPPTLPIDYEEKLSNIFLPKSMEQLKETFELLQQQQQQHQPQENKVDIGENRNDFLQEERKQHKHISPRIEETLDKDYKSTKPNGNRQNTFNTNVQLQVESGVIGEDIQNPYYTFCKKCGENFESEMKLDVHMLQEHGNNSDGNEENEDINNEDGRLHRAVMTPYDILASVKVKMERPDYDSPSSPQSNATSSHNDILNTLTNGKEQWINTSFPFQPEAAAAAALSAGGYLPLLGVPSFSAMDGLNRPPLRIFNPEAYCDLCNKEFCNKYFLKTHKANKHGIYDPAIPPTPGAGDPGNNNALNQIFQLQVQQQQNLQLQQQPQQQQQNKQQQQSNVDLLQQQQPTESLRKQNTSQSQTTINTTLSTPSTPTTSPATIFCDICSKKFTNIFAMRRHRSKIHDQLPEQSHRGSPNDLPPSIKSDTSTMHQDSVSKTEMTDDSTVDATIKQFQMPEGFRQDFTLEQEEVAFTPQPRKLSPQSQQQARESNFAHDKLRRLGVLSPEAFCEICCKEYCNKYFLRTHKWKRHGIFVPPDDIKDDQLPHKMPWPFMPFNLMMANEKAVTTHRMLTAATVGNIIADEPGNMVKRIKLEQTDDTAEETSGIRPNSKNVANEAETGQHTPEPAMKGLNESLTPSPETAMGLQNLQKLQSMIQQLSDLNGKRPYICQMCGREIENQFALQAHMMAEHNGAMDPNTVLPLNFQQQILQQQQRHQAQKLSPSEPVGISVNTTNELRCNQCDREFMNLTDFKQHIAEVHLLPNSPIREGFVTPERPINPNPTSSVTSASNNRPPYTITPTSSYCEICNKELCNKYFMKTHMQRMHGIEIENGAQIGGVVCNICNKELCSKYFLRVHKHNTHGIVEEGAPLPQPRQNGLNFETQQQQLEADIGRSLNTSPFGGSGSGDTKSESSDVRNYTEVCPICARRFRSAKWLRAHLVGDHGHVGIEKMRELEHPNNAPTSKPASPTLKIPNGSNSTSSSSTTITASNINTANMMPNSVNIAQALQTLNAQHLLGTGIPKSVLPGMFGAVVADQALHSPRFKEYQCSICPFTTPYYAFLFIHERSHSILNTASEPTMPEISVHNENMQKSISNDDIKSELLASSAKEKSHRQPETETYFCHISSPTSDLLSKNNIEPTNLTTRTSLPNETSIQLASQSNSSDEIINKIDKKESTSYGISKPCNIPIKSERIRSTATSPVLNLSVVSQNFLQDTALKSGKPACYAIPKDNDDKQQQQMQAFIVEESPEKNQKDNELRKYNRFVPAIIYLPVRERISKPLTVCFNLTPA